jgi:signal transduction histidine kinase
MPFEAKPSSITEQDSLKMEEWIASIKNRMLTDTVSVDHLLDSLFLIGTSENNHYLLFTASNLKGVSCWMKLDYDSAIYFYKEAYIHSVEGDLKEKRINVLSNIALAFKTLSETDSAIIYYNKSIEYSKEAGLINVQARNMIHLNYLYTNKGNYPEAAKLLFEAKQIVDDYNDHALLASVHGALGYLYNTLDNFEEARKNFLLSVHYDELDSLNFISHTNYFNLGEMYWNMKRDIDSSEYYLEKGLEAAPLFHKEVFRLAIEFLKGNYFLDQNQNDSAVIYYERVRNHYLTDKDAQLKAAVTVNLGFANFNLKNVKKAKDFFEEGQEFSLQNNLLQNRVNALKGLILIDSVEGNLDKAYLKLRELVELEKTTQREHAINKLAQIEIEKDLELVKLKYDHLTVESELKTRQIANHKYLNYIYLVLLVGSVLFTIVQIVNYRKIIQLNKRLLTKQGELEELNKTKDKFFSILSHDLKSPFSGLLGLMEMLSVDWKNIEDNEKHDIVKVLYSNSLSTYQLLEDLLSWSKSQQGLIRFKPEVFYLADLVNEVSGLLHNSISKKSIKLEVNVDSQLQLNTDYRLLRQVIQNFVNNAVKYTPRGGVVRINVNSDDKCTRIDVEDTGIGIPEDKISKLFDLDCDFSRPGTENEKSTGMGLILSKEFSRTMNAEILVKSTVEKGSTFTIRFAK